MKTNRSRRLRMPSFLGEGRDSSTFSTVRYYSWAHRGSGRTQVDWLSTQLSAQQAC
jgi:hypothetical protein